MPAPPTTLGLLALGWGFTRKNFRNSTEWGFDPQKCFAEVYKDRYVEDAIRVQVKVLNTVAVEKTFEEVARWESQPALHETREHWDLIGVLLHRARISRGGAPHVDLLLPEEIALHQCQQVLSLRLGLLPLLVRI
jgi:hypothetical protein